MTNFGQDIADDGLILNHQTTVEDVKTFLKSRAESPMVFDDVTIWDFCSYEPDREALREAVRIKLEGDTYIIPFQVTGTWGPMFHLLPEQLKRAEILVYNPSEEVYMAYDNYTKELASEQTEAFRQDLAKRVADVEPQPTTYE